MKDPIPQNSFSPEGNRYSNGIDYLKQTQKHEQIISKESHDHEIEKIKLENDYKLKCQNQQLGMIGRAFGGAEQSSKNIAATLCVLLLFGATIISVIVYNNERTVESLSAIWQVVIPVITLSLGYLFGKKG